MSYSSGEADILTRLQAMTNWNVDNTSRQDWKILSSGKDSEYVVLRPGEPINEYISIGARTAKTTWSTFCEFFRRYETSADPVALQALVDDFLREIEKYPHLGEGVTSNIQSAVLADGNPMQEIIYNNVLWSKWEVRIEWQEERQVTPAE